MKQLLSAVAGVFAISTLGCSQRLNEKDLPEPVKTSFSKAYDSPGKVKWEKENKNEYEASFELNGKEISVVYSNDGILQETETEITVAELPAAVTDYITKNYKNAKISEAEEIIKKDGSRLYEAEVNKKDLLFDASGKLLKTDD
jgi:uncharacterized lipoprotein YehR (DUF1307 family)